MPTATRAAAIVLVLAAAGVGCGTGDAGPAWEAGECDGAPCVIGRRPAWDGDASWTVVPEPALHVLPVGDDGELLFSNVVDVRTLADGRIGVADVRSSRVLVFSGTGALLGVIGGRGEGPGEFRRILWFTSCSSSAFHVLDLGRRLVTLEPTGEVRESADLGNVLEQATQRRVCDRLGTLAGLAHTGGPVMNTEPTLVRTRGFAKVAVRGEPVRTLGEFPVREFLAGIGDGRPHLLGRHTSLALGPGVVYVGTGDRFEIDVYTTGGDLLRRQTRPYGSLELTAAHLDALIEQELPLLPDRDAELHLMQIRAGNNPDSLPAYDDLQVDPQGALWAHHFRLPGTSANTWSVFDAEGIWLGEVAMPERFTATEIGNDSVLGVLRDELDEQSVASYPLQRNQ